MDNKENSDYEYEHNTKEINKSEENVQETKQNNTNAHYEKTPEEQEIDATERANENNANVVSNAADVAIATGNPYAVAAGLIVKGVDAKTDGRGSEVLGKATTVANKAIENKDNPEDTNLQKGLNYLSESGAADKVGTAASIYSMGKGGAGNAGKAAEATQTAEKAAEAANKAETAANAAKEAANASKGAEAAEKTQQAAEKAKEAEDATNEVNERIQKQQEIKRKEEIAHSDYKRSNQKNPYDNPKSKSERNVDEIIDDKIEENKKKTETDPNKPGYEQEDYKIEKFDDKILNFALDVVDVALDTVDSLLTKIRKVTRIAIITLPFLPLIIIFIIILLLGAMFGVDSSPKTPNYIEKKEEVIQKESNLIINYPSSIKDEIQVEDYIAGVTYLFLKDDIESYKNEGINMETLYGVYGVIISLNLNDNATTNDEKYYINYNIMNYCNTGGCVKVSIDGNETYINEELSKDYEIIESIPPLDNENKKLLENSTAEGYLLAIFISNNNSHGKELNEDLKQKIHDYVKNEYTYEEILDNLHIKYEQTENE